ncbi:MAG: nuclear transport factor 2 family protein [Acidobacteria bacterium]|nr:nuclear transport factor 2 family protein [Acidobacteriota bacterium]
MPVPDQSNSAIIAAYLDAVIQKDASAVDRFFASDVEYVVNGAPVATPDGDVPPISSECQRALPWLGLHAGRDAVKRFLAHMHRNLEVTGFGPREVISANNKAAAFGWFRLHALSTDRTMDIAYSIRFELHNGLITKYHFLENTLDVAGAFRTSGQWVLETDGATHWVPARSPGESRGPASRSQEK